MTKSELEAYIWAMNQNFPSVAARHAKTLAECAHRLTPYEETGLTPEQVEALDRHAHWIVDECDSTDTNPSRAWIEFHCSECGSDFALEEGQYGWYMEDDVPYKYCPICGARMDGKNE